MVTIDAVSNIYDAVSTTVTTGSTNQSLRLAGLFLNVTEATFCRITTDQTITIRFNNTSNPPIVMTSSESPRKWTRAEEGLKVSDIFITNTSGSTANIKVELYR